MPMHGDISIVKDRITDGICISKIHSVSEEKLMKKRASSE